ncbi:MAG: hypothetical protein WA347_04750 [Rhabdochlamydiaceae bacterium]|jgi:heme-degrading monooxygenase HmoA
MGNYRALVHYTFKKGMETQGLNFLENELVKKAQNYGCHFIELWHNEKETSHVVGVAIWNSLEEARNFQSHWQEKEKELTKFCTEPPKREFFHLKSTYAEKAKKAA